MIAEPGEAHDPYFDYVDQPVLCPNPACESGAEYFVDFPSLVGVTCPVCKGEIIITNGSDIDDVYKWADARRITVKVAEAIDFWSD